MKAFEIFRGLYELNNFFGIIPSSMNVNMEYAYFVYNIYYK